MASTGTDRARPITGCGHPRPHLTAPGLPEGHMRPRRWSRGSCRRRGPSATSGRWSRGKTGNAHRRGRPPTPAVLTPRSKGRTQPMGRGRYRSVMGIKPWPTCRPGRDRSRPRSCRPRPTRWAVRAAPAADRTVDVDVSVGRDSRGSRPGAMNDDLEAAVGRAAIANLPHGWTSEDPRRYRDRSHPASCRTGWRGAQGLG